MKPNKLKAKVVERELNLEYIASALGIDRSSIYRKMNNFEKFTIGEAKQMKRVLDMTDAEAIDIFLS